jgi:hypothetical protein
MAAGTPAWTFVLWWSSATALGWLLAHPLLQRYVLEAAWLLTIIGVPAMAAVSLIGALMRRWRKADPRWRAIASDTGRVLVVVFSLILCQAGSIAGVLQWPVLKRYVSSGAWWAVAGSGGSLVAANVGRLIGDAGEPFNYGVEGAAIGLLQWLVLRREVGSTVWWVPISAIGWLVGGLTIAPVWNFSGAIGRGATGHTALLVYHTVPRAIGGLICGIVTGAALWMLLKNRREDAS